MSGEHFRFSPDILRRLGEELITHVDQGIIELVRNAYDADALTCAVELVDVEEVGGTLRVLDDGLGMSRDTIRGGWLVLGRSSKSGRARTALGRLPVGDKGLGRLAALRMGSAAQVRTRPATEPGTEYSLTLDWARYEAVDVVEGVELEIEAGTTTECPGTTVEVSNLGVRLGRREVQRLARALLLLADPFDSAAGFRPRLIAPAFSDLERRVREAYFDAAEFRLVARVDEAGVGFAEVYDWTGRLRWQADHPTLSGGTKRGRLNKQAPPYAIPPATFELWAFNLSPKGFTARVPATELRDWLEAVGGVHVYHRGLRVQPYGDPGFDWLDMNLARARSPEDRPSTNNSVGRVTVLDARSLLLQKTDRTGFVENDTFAELRRFTKDALNWMAQQRTREAEKRRAAARATAPEAVVKARSSLQNTLSQLPVPERSAVQAAVEQLESARQEEARTLRDDLQLYRTLGTVGTTAAVFAHEAGKPLTRIDQMGKLIEQRARRVLGDQYHDLLENPVRHVLSSARALLSFAHLPLRLLAREKRRVAPVDVHAVVRDLAGLFEPFLADAQITIRLELADATPRVRGSVAAIEAILANLITNAIAAFDNEDARADGREIAVRTDVSGQGQLSLRVLDNGPGIAGISLEDIWLPGQTTRDGGTGLGLTIVRDTVGDLGGHVHAVTIGDLGGAEFLVQLPLLAES